jgi:acetyl esterase/lipase
LSVACAGAKNRARLLRNLPRLEQVTVFMRRILLSGLALMFSMGLGVGAIAQQPAPPPGFYIKEIAAPAQPDAIPLATASASGGLADTEQWDDMMGQRSVRNVNRPTLTPVLPAPGHATGAAVVIAPGGAFIMLSMDNEGWPVAHWFADHGVAAFVLKYRLDPTPRATSGFMEALAQRFGAAGQAHQPPDLQQPQAEEDAEAAMGMVRANAARWGVDPHRVGLVGFSAGAMTALRATLADHSESKPDFLGLLYGPMSSVSVPKDAPPLFDALAADDGLFGAQGFGLVSAWREAGRPVEFHYYGQGGHGFGLGKPGTTTQAWPSEFLAWMRMQGFLTR